MQLLLGRGRGSRPARSAANRRESGATRIDMKRLPHRLGTGEFFLCPGEFLLLRLRLRRISNYHPVPEQRKDIQ